ncbi:MAG: trypsin-like serine protease [Alphaproteobacteria bacterium]|nr:trypsin-like serine protease [Alphaproteobacteria bacterium]
MLVVAWSLAAALAAPLPYLGEHDLGIDAPGPVLAPPTAAPVVGGEVAEKGRWPDAAGIVFRGSYVGCTGTLVAPDVVLTAGHCVGEISHVMLDGTNWLAEEGAEFIEVVEQRAHPWLDIAVLILAEDSAVPPRAIAQDCVVDGYLREESEVVVVGFGATDGRGRRQTSRLHEGTTVVQTPDCSEREIDGLVTGCLRGVPEGSELGAGGNGVDACFGDSGGPLYLPTPLGTFLVGVTSRAYMGVPERAPCEYGGIYSRPDSVVDWIEDVAGHRVAYPPCNTVPEAEVDDLVVAPGAEGEVQVRVEDPDSTGFTLKVLAPPTQGTVALGPDGTLIYTADADATGPDAFTVQVRDDGDVEYPNAPKSRTELTVNVDVRACGCASAPSGPVGAWIVGLLALAWRRRR